jgi:hypothetical protein
MLAIVFLTRGRSWADVLGDLSRLFCREVEMFLDQLTKIIECALSENEAKSCIVARDLRQPCISSLALGREPQ